MYLLHCVTDWLHSALLRCIVWSSQEHGNSGLSSCRSFWCWCCMSLIDVYFVIMFRMKNFAFFFFFFLNDGSIQDVLSCSARRWGGGGEVRLNSHIEVSFKWMRFPGGMFQSPNFSRWRKRKNMDVEERERKSESGDRTYGGSAQPARLPWY